MVIKRIVFAGCMLSACTNTPAPEVPLPQVPKGGVTTTPEIQEPTSAVLMGYYFGTVEGSEPKNISLWLCDDSTYIRQEGAPDRSPQGAIGVWSMHQGKVMLNAPEGKQDWAFSATDHTLTRTGVDLKKVEWSAVTEYPEMRLKGAYSYMADAQSFRPCGSKFNWPAAMGDAYTDAIDKESGYHEPQLEQDYLKAVKTAGDPWDVEVLCRIVIAPAMEGDLSEEYIFIDEVVGELESGCQ